MAHSQLLLTVMLWLALAPVALASGREKVFCSRVDGKLICGQQLNVNLSRVGDWHMPNLLIIGASKTGTTALTAMLNHHPDVKMAMNARGDYETEYLLPKSEGRPKEKFSITDKSLLRYSLAYLGGPITNGTKYKIVGDKVPGYSSHPLVPYTAKLILPEKPKLIFTIRDPLAADMSLFMYRNWAGKMKLGYDEWVSPRLEAFETWWKCRKDTFYNMLIGDLYLEQKKYVSINDLYDPDIFTWQTTQTIENEIYSACGGMGKVIKNIAPTFHDYYQERLYGINLRRWVQVYGEDSVLCYTLEDSLRYPDKIFSLVAQHLDIDPTKLQMPEEYAEKGQILNAAIQSQSDYNRTYAKLLSVTYSVRESKKILDTALNQVRNMLNSTVTQADLDFIARMCTKSFEENPSV